MKVRDIMHGITKVDGNLSVLDVARMMSDKNIGSVLIESDGCVRIVTERDILKKVVALNKDVEGTRISEIATDCEHTIESKKDLFDASDILNKHNIRRLPVTERGRIVGIITARDIAKSLNYLSARKFYGYGKNAYDRLER